MPVSARCRATPRSRCRSAISGWCRQRARRPRGAARPPRRHGRAPSRSRRDRGQRRAACDRARRTNGATRSAAGPAHRAGARPGFHLRLSACARRLAPRRRRDRSVLAARRRAAAGRAPIAAGCPAAIRSCTPRAGRGRRFLDGLRRFAADAAGAWRVRRLHGAGRSLEDAAGSATPWPDCSATPPASPSENCISAIARRGYCPTACSGGRRDRARPRIPLCDAESAGDDAPLPHLRTAKAAGSAKPAAGAAASAARSFTPSPVAE